MTNSSQMSLETHQNDTSYIYSRSEVSPRRYNCNACSTSFRRREHFERHIQSHSKSKDFKCDICSKQFTRRDTLQRHLAIHTRATKNDRKPPTRAPHACLNCAKSKQRCSGSHPCGRCNHKNWLCLFPGGPGRMEPMANPNDQRALPNDICEPFLVSDIPPEKTDHSASTGSNSVTLLERTYTDSAILNRPGQTIQDYNAPSPMFESFLLWPLDDDLGHGIIPDDQISPQTTPGFSGTIAQQPTISNGGTTTAELRNVSHEISRDCTEDPGALHSGRSNTRLQETGLTEEDRDILISEDYAHTPRLSNELYESIHALYAGVCLSSPELSLSSLPSVEILHVCTQLYFEHFHPSFPILHHATFEVRDSSWLLYLAMAALGSQYSRLSTRAKISSDLVKIIHVALLQSVNSRLTMQSDLELAQATLLLHFALLFGGTREGMMNLQHQRNMLITMCRPLLVPGILFSKSWILSNASAPSEDWGPWITKESWKRVIYFTWLLECFQLILLDLPTIIAVSELHIGMPCDDDLWRCQSFEKWKQARALQRDPQECPSVTSLLRMEAMSHECISQWGDSALWISAASVYVADRQASQQQALQLLSSTHTPNHRKMDSPVAHAIGTEEDTVDTILSHFQQAAEHRYKSPVGLIVTKMSLILRLLRFMKYRVLYLSAGWMAQKEEIRAARQNIAELMHAKSKQARQSLLHAAQLFRIIRSQRQFEPFDTFIILMAILYIWNYDKNVVAHTPLDEGDGEILRVDQNMDAKLKESWIAGTLGLHKQLHISGIGVLNGQDSMPRILKEGMRILDHDKAWSRQANAIKRSLHQILRGNAPSFAS